MKKKLSRYSYAIHPWRDEILDVSSFFYIMFPFVSFMVVVGIVCFLFFALFQSHTLAHRHTRTQTFERHKHRHNHTYTTLLILTTTAALSPKITTKNKRLMHTQHNAWSKRGTGRE